MKKVCLLGGARQQEILGRGGKDFGPEDQKATSRTKHLEIPKSAQSVHGSNERGIRASLFSSRAVFCSVAHRNIILTQRLHPHSQFMVDFDDT